MYYRYNLSLIHIYAVSFEPGREVVADVAWQEDEAAGSISLIEGIDEKLVIPNTSMSVYDGCVVCWREMCIRDRR